MRRWWTACAVTAALGCGSHHANEDARVTPADARTDAPASTPAYPATQLAPSGGRVTGGGYTMDVQLGQPTSQAPASGGGKTIQANTPIKP